MLVERYGEISRQGRTNLQKDGEDGRRQRKAIQNLFCEIVGIRKHKASEMHLDFVREVQGIKQQTHRIGIKPDGSAKRTNTVLMLKKYAIRKINP